MTLMRTLHDKLRAFSHWAGKTFLRPDSIVILDRQPLPVREDRPA